MAGLTPENRAAYIRMGYEVDQASINAVLAANTKVESSLNTVQKAADNVGTEAIKTSNRLKEAFAQSRSSIEADTKAVNELRDSLTKVKPASEIFSKSGGGGASGGIGVEGLRRTGGALRQLGAGEAGDIVSTAGDIGEVTKSVKALGSAAIQLPGLLGQMAQAGAGVGAMAGTTGAALGALLVPVVAVAAPVVALGVAIGELKKRFDEGHGAVQKFLDDQNRDLELRIKIAQESRTMSSQELASHQADMKIRLDAMKADIDARTNQINITQRQIEQGNLLEKAVGESTRGQQLDDLQKLVDEHNKLAVEYQTNRDKLEPLIKAREQETAAIQATIQAFDRQRQTEVEYRKLAKSGTSDQIKQQIEDAESNAEAVANEWSKLIDKTDEDSKAKAKQLKEEYERLKGRVEDLNRLLPQVEDKEREKAWADQVAKGYDERIKNEQKYADLIKSGSSQTVKDRIDAIEREKKSAQEAITTFEQMGESNEEAQKKAQEYRDRLDKLNQEEGKLTSEILPLIEAREAETKAIEKQKAQAGIAQKLEGDLQALEEKTNQERISINEKYHDKLIEITRNAVDEANKALAELQQKQADLQTSLARDEAKAGRDAADQTLTIQIKAQRAERDALQEHLQRLQEIKKSDFAADQKDLLDRNFQNIYLRSLQKTQQVDQENTRYGQEGTKRQQAIQDEINDANRQRQIDRRERLIAFQQQLQDANTAYQRQLVSAKQAKDRELLLAKEAHDRELKDLQAKYTQEATARQKAATQELHLLELTEAQRLEIISKYAKKANDLINRAMTSAVVKRAGGGSLETGQLAMVNEPGSSGQESFNGIPLPGAGLFMPMQAGYVSPNGGGGGNTTISVPVTVNGATDPATTARIVQEQVVYVVKRVMGK